MSMLVLLKDPEVVSAIEPLLGDDDLAVRREAADALAQLGWQPAGAAERAELDVACEFWEKAVAAGPAAIDPLLRRLQQDATTGEALQAMERILQEGAIEDVPVFQLRALAAVGQGASARKFGVRGSMQDPALRSTVACRRIAQLARTELQRRRQPV